MLKKTLVPYYDEKIELQAFCAYQSESKRPLVILCHAWAGRDAFIQEKAELIAQLGYIGFALDMYGKNILGKSKEENASLKAPFIADRALLQRRILKGYQIACSLPSADTSKIVALGYGFGGICALDLARSGVSLNGAISVYGHFDAPDHVKTHPIKAKILILHGFNDPIATIEQLKILGKELDESNVDWQANLYGNTKHAFVNPQANDAKNGLLYNPIAANHSWNDIEAFLQQLFK